MSHKARVRWLSAKERGRIGLPTALRYVGIGRFLEDLPGEDIWSVVCCFVQPPPEHRSDVSDATVSFLVDEAPQQRLRAGVRFSLYEGLTKVADVDVLD